MRAVQREHAYLGCACLLIDYISRSPWQGLGYQYPLHRDQGLSLVLCKLFRSGEGWNDMREDIICPDFFVHTKLDKSSLNLIGDT